MREYTVVGDLALQNFVHRVQVDDPFADENRIGKEILIDITARRSIRVGAALTGKNTRKERCIGRTKIG